MAGEPPSSAPRYRFGDLTLDVGQHRVWRGDRAVPLGNLTFELLRTLVEAAPRVVTQTELTERVWGARRIVTPETLAQRVMLLRRAIGDEAAHPIYVEAVRGIGYRLLPSVERVTEPPGAEVGASQSDASRTQAVGGSRQPAGRRTTPRLAAVLGGGAVLLALAGYVSFSAMPRGANDAAAGSIGVMPFANLSADEDDAYFAAGLSEELLGRIAEIEDVRVAGRAALADGGESLAALGARLGLEQIVEGSVRRSGDRIRIDVRLVDTQSGLATWSRIFDRAAGDAFAAQDEVASTVADALSLQLRSRSSDLRYGGTASFEAYEHFLRGRATWNVDPPRAVEELERALALDPDYRQPWLYLTYAYGWVLDFATTQDAAELALQRMQHAGARAAAVLRDSWEGSSALAWARVATKDWLGADAAIKTARGLAAAAGAQDEMLRSHALYLLQIGRVAEALPLLEARRALDPLDRFTSSNMQVTLILLGRTAEARAEYERGASVPGTSDVVSELDIPWLIAQGDERQIDAAFTGATERVRALASVWRSPTDALRVLRAARDSPGYHARREFSLLAVLAGHYGDDALAVELLRDAYLGTGYAGFFRIWHPALRNARRTDAFEQFVRDVGLVELWERTGHWGDYCRPSGTDGIECS
jgi:TolB-like protein/DNA-binding winged helix-turn-helix (wHTH) protein